VAHSKSNKAHTGESAICITELSAPVGAWETAVNMVRVATAIDFAARPAHRHIVKLELKIDGRQGRCLPAHARALSFSTVLRRVLEA